MTAKDQRFFASFLRYLKWFKWFLFRQKNEIKTHFSLGITMANYLKLLSLPLTVLFLIGGVENLSGQESSLQTMEYINQLKSNEKPIPPLPTGPPGRGIFGAFYTKLAYYPHWDKDWRVGPDADVLVLFDKAPFRFIFWRGTNYIPHWVSENNIWYNNEFTETWETIGSSEPMSDKQCRFSHVRIIENNNARVVVHWRYALNDVNYRIAWPDSTTGWGDWCDEYYTIYPDGTSVRKITLYSSYHADDERQTDDEGHEWQEGIVLYHAYTTPEAAVNLDAVHVANMQGETGIWRWDISGQPTTPTPEGSNIVLMNIKSVFKPFVISPEGCHVSAYEGCQGGSHFRWRDHWPTTLQATPGRDASGKQAAHGSFFHITDIPFYFKEGIVQTKILLHGMTEQTVSDLVPLAKSWLKPPVVSITSGTKEVRYDRSERAYVLNPIGNTVVFVLKVSPASPLVNPVFILRNWGNDPYTVKINSKMMTDPVKLRSGYIKRIDRTDLILWFDYHSDSSVKFEINKSS